jgi:hypothetical protein
MSRKRLLTPRGKPLEKPGALSGQQRLIRQCGVPPLMYQFGETLTAGQTHQNSPVFEAFCIQVASFFGRLERRKP